MTKLFICQKSDVNGLNNHESHLICGLASVILLTLVATVTAIFFIHQVAVHESMNPIQTIYFLIQ